MSSSNVNISIILPNKQVDVFHFRYKRAFICINKEQIEDSMTYVTILHPDDDDLDVYINAMAPFIRTVYTYVRFNGLNCPKGDHTITVINDHSVHSPHAEQDIDTYEDFIYLLQFE